MGGICQWLWDHGSSLIALIVNVATLSVIFFGFLLTRPAWLRLSLIRSRQNAFRDAGAPSIPRRAISARVQKLLALEGFDVVDEIEWLCATLGINAPLDAGLPMLVSRDQIKRLASGYEAHAAQLNSRTLLNASQIPLIGQCIHLARETATYLRTLSAGMNTDGSFLSPPSSTSVQIPHRGVTLRAHVFPDPATRTAAYDLVISYRKHLTIPDQGEHPWLETTPFTNVTHLPTTRAERSLLAAQFSTGRVFDGLVPRLVQWDQQHDAASGRRRIHLSLATCSYSSVILDHYPAAAQVERAVPATIESSPRVRGVRTHRDVHGDQVGLLTLSLVPVTRDGYLVLAQRSRVVGSHEGLYGPAVNGNLEMRSRAGVALDVDRFGVPDPRCALVREAHEELGMSLAQESIYITGLVSFDSPTERGTSILMNTTMLPITFEQLRDRSDQGDLIEGRWELGHDLMGIRIPRNADEISVITRWVLNSTELTPHASAATLAVLAAVCDTPPLADIPIDASIPRPDGAQVRYLAIR